MPAKPPPIPSHLQGFIPYLIVKDAESAIEFYSKAFAGEAGLKLKMKSGEVGHAEVIIGTSTIMLAEEKEEWNVKGPLTIGGCPLTLTLYVEDVDKSAKIALDAGMTLKKPLEDQFYGDRMVSLTDPYGYEWCLGSRIEDVSAVEMQKRMDKLY